MSLLTSLVLLPAYAFSSQNIRKVFCFLAFLAEAIGFFYLSSLSVQENPHVSEVINSVIFAMGILFNGTMYLPVGPLALLAGITIVSGATGVCFSYVDISATHFVTFSLAVFVASLVAVFRNSESTRMQVNVAKKEYRTRERLIPSHILRSSSHKDRDSEEVFLPSERQCVYIASDWRGYQKLSETIDPRKLTEALNAYYDLCDSLLQKYFPEGNYYSDWIADELFVVVLPVDDKPEINISEQAVNFSVELTHQRPSFEEQYAFPEAIDIGLSYGPAIVGLMGPSNHKKATALGQYPGKSRRYQDVGKYLRKSMYASDRVIFGQSILMNLKNIDYDIKKSSNDSNMKFRDLEDNFVFYIEDVQEKCNEADSSHSLDENSFLESA